VHPLVAHCHLASASSTAARADAGASRHRDDDVSRHEHDVLAGEGGGGVAEECRDGLPHPARVTFDLNPDVTAPVQRGRDPSGRAADDA
jgi:hypothetical protein